MVLPVCGSLATITKVAVSAGDPSHTTVACTSMEDRPTHDTTPCACARAIKHHPPIVVAVRAGCGPHSAPPARTGGAPRT